MVQSTEGTNGLRQSDNPAGARVVGLGPWPSRGAGGVEVRCPQCDNEPSAPLLQIDAVAGVGDSPRAEPPMPPERAQ